MDRKQETKLVKDELARYGINAKVTHGRGTAWGWLELNVGSGQQFGPGHPEAAEIISRFAIRKTLEVTGRAGEYDGRTLCLTQDHWTDKNGSIPIVHDLPKLLQSIPQLQDLR